jgi:hypothetical protein
MFSRCLRFAFWKWRKKVAISRVEHDTLERCSASSFPCSGSARAIGTITRVAVQVEIDPVRINATRSSERVLYSANRPETQLCLRPTREAILIWENW